jgi:hypothetical protein
MCFCSFRNLEVIWYFLPRFGILCQEKSGNPVYVHGFVKLFPAWPRRRTHLRSVHAKAQVTQTGSSPTPRGM